MAFNYINPIFRREKTVIVTILFSKSYIKSLFANHKQISQVYSIQTKRKSKQRMCQIVFSDTSFNFQGEDACHPPMCFRMEQKIIKNKAISNVFLMQSEKINVAIPKISRMAFFSITYWHQLLFFLSTIPILMKQSDRYFENFFIISFSPVGTILQIFD